MTENTNEKYFATANDARLARDEEELAALEAEREKVLNPPKPEDEAPAKEPAHIEPDAAGAPKGEDVWKKRYSDLRRYVDKELKPEFEKQIENLRTELTKASGNSLPKTEAELAEWAQQYPESYAVVKTLATQIAQEQLTEVKQFKKQIEMDRLLDERNKAESELLKIHPDMPELRESDDFQSWVEEQGGWVLKALRENFTNWRDAANAVSAYKAAKGITTKDKRQREQDDAKDASRLVTSKNKAPEVNPDDGMLKESEIEKMSAAEFEKNEKRIMEAYRKGKIVFDLSGGAR